MISNNNNYNKKKLLKLNKLISQNSKLKTKKNLIKLNINKIYLVGNSHNNTWDKILPISCQVAPLYFTSSYPWTYRMSAKINNYLFGKKPIHNLLTFNINLPIKHQLRGSYFFSNYDTTNYGKLNNKRMNLYRVYPSLLSHSLLQSCQYIYKPAVTNTNLAYLPLIKYNINHQTYTKVSGNPWFVDPIAHAFLRRYYNIQPYHIMSREIDSVISLFDNKLSVIFDPLSAVYNLQRNFTLGLSPTSQVFMPEKYLRNNDVFYRRFSLWSQKYYNFWYKIQNFNVFSHQILLDLINFNSKQLGQNTCVKNYKHLNIKLQKMTSVVTFNTTGKLNLLKNEFNGIFNNNRNLFDCIDYRANNLQNNIFKLPNKIGKLCIDIKQGRSLMVNLVFSTKKMAVLNSRYLYHYYPFYTKKPYGTGIKQILLKKANKFNKNKIEILNQMIKLSHMSSYVPNIFYKIQQLSRWTPYKYDLTAYDSYSLNLLSLQKKNDYLFRPQFKNTNTNKFVYKFKHLMPNSNKWQKFTTKLQLYYYLLYNNYYRPQSGKLIRKNKWFKNFKNTHVKNFNNNDLQLKWFVQFCILFYFINLLNREVYIHLTGQNLNSSKNKHITTIINKLTKFDNSSNWLKYYLIPDQREELYNLLVNRNLTQTTLPEMPENTGFLTNQCLLTQNLNGWLNNHSDFYPIFYLFNIHLNNLNELNFLTNFDTFNTFYQQLGKFDYNDLVKSSLPMLPSYQYTYDIWDQFNMLKLNKNFSYNVNKYSKIINLNKHQLQEQFANLWYLYQKAVFDKPQFNFKWSVPAVIENWRLTSIQLDNIMKTKNKFRLKNKLNSLEREEKRVYIQYQQKIKDYHNNFDEYLEQVSQKKIQWDKWQQHLQALKIEKLKQEQLVQQQKQQQRLAQQKLHRERKVQQQQLLQEKKIADRKIIEVGLGVKLDRNIWHSLTETQRLSYHIHQKKLRKQAKNLVVQHIQNNKKL